MELVYVLIALVALAGAYFLFFRKPAGDGASASLPEKQEKVGSATSVAPEAAEKRAKKKAAETAGDSPSAEPERAAPPAEVPAPSARHIPTPTPGRLASEPPPPPVRTPKPSEPPRATSSVGTLERLRKGLTRSRSGEGFFGRLRSLFAGKEKLSPELERDIEEVLLTSDVGTETTQLLLEGVRTELERGELANPESVWNALAAQSRKILELDGRATGTLNLRARPTLILMVGVNGAGKTTTIGKLATKLHANGHKCVLAAGDTFRAAAVQQLIVWGERVGCEVVRGKDGADPGSVVFEAVKRAQETGADIVLADTAGRLHTKSNLMAEMKKIAKTAEKALPGAPHEILLVVDATNGQNALAQAREFHDALPLTGIVLTKLDGTAKGGVVLGIAHTLKLPVRFVGLGERADDLHEFRASEFVEALLGPEAGKPN